MIWNHVMDYLIWTVLLTIPNETNVKLLGSKDYWVREISEDLIVHHARHNEKSIYVLYSYHNPNDPEVVKRKEWIDIRVKDKLDYGVIGYARSKRVPGCSGWDSYYNKWLQTGKGRLEGK